MLKIQKIILLSLTFSFINSAQASLSSKGNWYINSPKVDVIYTDNNLFQEDSFYNALIKTGQEAHEFWKNTKSNSNKASHLNRIFKKINSKFLIKVIDEILQDNALLKKITTASYRNATGFLKIVLTDNDNDSWKIRLHAWKPNKKEFPHNHKWDFFSKVMSGYLHQDIYSTAKRYDKNAIQYRVCEPVSLMPILEDGELPCPCRDSYEIAEKKSCSINYANLKIVSQDNIGVGESYFMPNDLIHTIVPGKNSLTLIFTSERVVKNSNVFVPIDEINSVLTKHAPSITQTELITELKLVKKILKKLPLSNRYLPELIATNHNYFDKKNPVFKTNNWRSKLSSLKEIGLVKQLSKQEKKKYIVSTDNTGNLLINQKKVTPSTDYLFVLTDNIMYASPKDFTHNKEVLICHSSFTDYASVDAAGVLSFDKERALKTIEAYSGHYAPLPKDMETALKYLKNINANIESTVIAGYNERY
jgi:hypothetical protein